MTEEDVAFESAVQAASDKVETPTFNGNMLVSLAIQSASVGKRFTYTYSSTGGLVSVEVANI